MSELENPRKRVMEDLKERNKDNMSTIAGEYYGSQFTYAETFKMFEDYKKAFVSLDGKKPSVVTLSAPSTIASSNAFFGAIDGNRILNMASPNFLYAYPEKYIGDVDSKTVVIFDGFLHEDFIKKLHEVGVKNIIITSVSDYMSPEIKKIALENGKIKGDFLDEYIKNGNYLPKDMNFIRIKEFAQEGSKIKENIEYPYDEKQIAAYFLTGATTSRYPKGVKLYADGLTKMAKIYDNMWIDFKPKDRQTVFIPIYYATGAIHGIYGGMVREMTITYQPRYDRNEFVHDLMQFKPNLVAVTPSHVATLGQLDPKDYDLSFLKYVFLGGEAMSPSLMHKYRELAKKFGIQYIINGYGMTETGSMSGVSRKDNENLDDVNIFPLPFIKYRIVDEKTGEILGNNQRGILQVDSPCRTAGYLEEEKNKELFTEDGWINTEDIAVRFDDGSYRVFGRSNDYFINQGKKYYMFDIESEVLEHPGVMEAEVIKFSINGNEYPAIDIVLKKGWENKKSEILNYIAHLQVPGIEYLLGTKFIDKFKTNMVTGKRDYLSLTDDKYGYYKKSQDKELYIQTDIPSEENCITYTISKDEILITSHYQEKKLVKKNN